MVVCVIEEQYCGVLLHTCIKPSVLTFQADEVKNVDIDFDQDFISRMVPKLDWNALIFAAQCVSENYYHYN